MLLKLLIYLAKFWKNSKKICKKIQQFIKNHEKTHENMKKGRAFYEENFVSQAGFLSPLVEVLKNSLILFCKEWVGNFALVR